MTLITEICDRLNKAYPKCLHLLSPRWLAENEESGEPSTGFCYLGAEAAWYALGRKPKVFVASYIDKERRRRGHVEFKATHWWLWTPEDGIIDPTHAQYGEDQPPYHLGRGGAFLTNFPSRRCRELIRYARLKVSKYQLTKRR